jgi:VanZ family protein
VFTASTHISIDLVLALIVACLCLSVYLAIWLSVCAVVVETSSHLESSRSFTTL